MDTNYDATEGLISDLETDLEDALGALVELEQQGRLPEELQPLLLLTPPDGASVHVSLRRRDSMRQLRRSASERDFDARSCGAWIVFELAPVNGIVDEGRGPAIEFRRPNMDVLLAEFVRALDRAEHDPHMSFVSLKYFRDQYLAKTGHAWAQDFDLARRVIQDATDQQILLLSRVPNPRQPEFPVTTILLNREHPLVKNTLPVETEDAANSNGADEG